ncbi:598_t:CDS:2, partial [Acaulospora colombiana]
LYDFHSTDVSSLSFRRDDIIQVLTRLESGWWDGLCNGERGWFPSNYVTDISNEEEMLDENEQASDWIPQRTPDGDLFYYNQRTGERTWELSMDDAESARSVNPRDSSSIGEGVNQGNITSSNNSITTRSTTNSPRSSVLTRSRQLPENWIQQPTEDGNTYYYYNTITKETRWTYPSGGGSTTATSTSSENDDEKEEEEIDDRVVSARVEEEVAEGEVDDVEAADKESIASSR